MQQNKEAEIKRDQGKTKEMRGQKKKSK